MTIYNLPLEIMVLIASFLDSKSLYQLFYTNRKLSEAAIIEINTRIKRLEKIDTIKKILGYSDYTSLFPTINTFLKLIKSKTKLSIADYYRGLWEITALIELGYYYQQFARHVHKGVMGVRIDISRELQFGQELIYGFKFTNVLMPMHSLSLGIFYYPHSDYLTGQCIRGNDITMIPKVFYINLQLKHIQIAFTREKQVVSLASQVRHLEFGYNSNINEQTIYKFIPPDLFEFLPNLKLLSFRACKLKTIPQILFNYINLELLDLSKNKIEQIDCDIKDGNKLKHLNLAKNKLRNLPSELMKLNNLVYFGLQQNKIETVAPSLKVLLSKTHNYDLLAKIGS